MNRTVNSNDYAYYRDRSGGEDNTVYEHQLCVLAAGADPERVFSDGAWETHHGDDERFLEARGVEHPLANWPGNVVLLKNEHHGRHTNGGSEDDVDVAPDPADPAQEERRAAILSAARVLDGGNEGPGAPTAEVIDAVVDVGVDRETAEHELEQLRMRGEMYEPAEGRVRVV